MGLADTYKKRWTASPFWISDCSRSFCFCSIWFFMRRI
jgi:hypothetical protein